MWQHMFSMPVMRTVWRRELQGTLLEDQYTFFIVYCLFLLRMRFVSDKRFRENQNIHFMFDNVFLTSRRLSDKLEKYSTAGQATDDNMANAHYVLDTKLYKNTLSVCNNY